MKNRENNYIEKDIDLDLAVQKSKKQIQEIRSHSSTQYSDYTDEELLVYIKRKGVFKLNQDEEIQKELREKQVQLKESEDIYKYRDKIIKARENFKDSEIQNEYTDQQILKYIKKKENEKQQFLILTCYLTVCFPILCSYLDQCCNSLGQFCNNIGNKLQKIGKSMTNKMIACIQKCGNCFKQGCNCFIDILEGFLSFVCSKQFVKIVVVLGMSTGIVFGIIGYYLNIQVIKEHGKFIEFLEDMNEKYCNIEEVKKQYEVPWSLSMMWQIIYFIGICIQGLVMIVTLVLFSSLTRDNGTYLFMITVITQMIVWVLAFILILDGLSKSHYFEYYEKFEDSPDGFIKYFDKCQGKGYYDGETQLLVEQVMDYGRKEISDFSTDKVYYSNIYLIITWAYGMGISPLISFILQLNIKNE